MNASSAAMLFDAVGSPDWPRVIAAYPRMVADVDLPDSLVDHVLADGDRELLADLAGNLPVLLRRPEIADRLAVTVDPVAALRAVHTTRKWEYRHWETLLRRCDPADPAWASADLPRVGLADMLGSVLVHSPVPMHHRVLERFTYSRDTFTPRERAYGHAWSIRHDVRTRQPELDGTAAAIDEMRTDDPRHARERAELDWTAIAAAHAARPFGAEVAAALTARGDCPDDVRVALFTAHPAEVAAWSRLPLAPLFTAPDAATATAGSMLIQRLHSLGRFAELVAHGRPAREVLFTAHRSRAHPDAPSDPMLTPMHTAIGRLLAATVGTDPASWKSLDRLLGGHKGTLAELCATATAAPDTGAGWPNAGPSFDRGPFLALLDAAGPAAQIALLPHLDRGTRHELFVHGVHRREWLDLDLPEVTADLSERRPSGYRDPALRALDAGASFAEVLDRNPVNPRPRRTWIESAIGSGLGTWTDVLRHGHPAAAVLTRAGDAHPVDVRPALRQVVGEADPAPDALLLAVRLLGDFPGTLPKLLTTAVAVTTRT